MMIQILYVDNKYTSLHSKIQLIFSVNTFTSITKENY